MTKLHKHIAFVGGGTAGHIQPFWAVMESLERLAPAYDIILKGSYIGLQSDIKSDFVKNSLPAWCEAYAIPAGKLHRHISLDQFVQVSRIGQGLIMANRLIRKLHPDVLFAKGGYVSVPLVWAAHRSSVPVYSHETDVVPGIANTWISKYADTVFTSFPAESYSRLPIDKVQYVGQPIRAEFFADNMESCVLDGRMVAGGQPLVTVIGGSQGARRINELVSAEWENYAKEAQVVHITGPREFTMYHEKWARLPHEAKSRVWVMPFVGEELPCIFNISTVVLSRAGGTISELAAAGAPSILLPLSTAAQDHQRANARVLEKAGAAIVVDETTTDPHALLQQVRELLHNERLREDISRNIRQYARKDAADAIAETILKRLSR